MGTGNLTECTDADFRRRYRDLLGLRPSCASATCSSFRSVLIPCRILMTCVPMMFAAREDDSLPRDYGENRRFPSRRKLRAGSQIRDANFRIETVESNSMFIAITSRRMRSRSFPSLVLERMRRTPSHLGAELMKAEIAWRLGKRYAQDEALGAARSTPWSRTARACAKVGHTLRASGSGELMPADRETTAAPCGRTSSHYAHRCHFGRGDDIARFRPSTTLDNLRAVPFAVADQHR